MNEPVKINREIVDGRLIGRDNQFEMIDLHTRVKFYYISRNKR